MKKYDVTSSRGDGDANDEHTDEDASGGDSHGDGDAGSGESSDSGTDAPSREPTSRCSACAEPRYRSQDREGR